MEILIYHNPGCSKSRRTVEIVQQQLQPQGMQPTIIEYLKTPPNHQQLDSLLRGMEMQPRELMRRGEAEYSEHKLDDPALSRDQLIAAMTAHPNLIERPIVVAGDQVIVARPPESVLAILP